jgi:hypothetical protein
VPVPVGGLVFSDDGRTATLQLKNIAVVDQPHWPKFKAETAPAHMDIKIVWQATDEKYSLNIPEKQCRVDGFKAIAKLEAAVKVPAIGFSWKSDPLESSKANFAIIGDEVNGKYYTQS